VPTYFWHSHPGEAPVSVNMILPDELETELLLRERIAAKTLAIDFTLGLEQGTGAEADWMANYKYHGISSLNSMQRDRAIEQLASHHERLARRFFEVGVQTEWVESLNGWFRTAKADQGSPLVARAMLGRHGGAVEYFVRYLEPAVVSGIPHWYWAEKASGRVHVRRVARPRRLGHGRHRPRAGTSPGRIVSRGPSKRLTCSLRSRVSSALRTSRSGRTLTRASAACCSREPAPSPPRSSVRTATSFASPTCSSFSSSPSTPSKSLIRTGATTTDRLTAWHVARLRDLWPRARNAQVLPSVQGHGRQRGSHRAHLRLPRDGRFTWRNPRRSATLVPKLSQLRTECPDRRTRGHR